MMRTEGEFTEFATVITPRLFRSALLLSGDWQLAEDLVQTTWPSSSSAGQGRHGRQPEAYAHGALTKTFLSYKRVRRNTELPTAAWSDRSAPPPTRTCARPVRGVWARSTRWTERWSSCATGRTGA